jgi:hypothetical protein
MKANALRNYTRKLRAKRAASALLAVLPVAAVGLALTLASHAATPTGSAEAETGTLASGATTVSDSNASGGQAIKFAGTQTGGGGSTCTNPSWNSKGLQDAQSFDDFWWVNVDGWNGTADPSLSVHACSASSWYAVSNQADHSGEVESYPDTEYDVGGRSHLNSSKTISQFATITSTFSENYPTAGNWDAGYDIWTNNWSNETMIWNQWAGGQSYWPAQATIALTLSGVPYHFYANGDELMFFRDTQVTSGSVDIQAALQWEVAHGYATATQKPTQLEYGVEICSTSGSETFPTTGLTFTVN